MLGRPVTSTKHTGHGRARPRTRSHIRSISNMKNTWLYILSCSLVLARCAPISDEAEPVERQDDRDNVEAAESDENLEEVAVAEDESEQVEKLPILPPIILIDFVNGTNATDEKSKRTINGNLGYGFQSNNLFTGKYNYYLPAGKSGTTVTIEESITPFLPTTIIEKVNPFLEKAWGHPPANAYQGLGLGHASSGSNAFSDSANTRHLFPRLRTEPHNGNDNSPVIFGQRTKLQKVIPNPFGAYNKFVSTQKPEYASAYSTSKPDLLGYSAPKSEFLTYSTPKPDFSAYSTPKPDFSAYSTPKPDFSAYSTPKPDFSAYSTPKPDFLGYSTPKPDFLGYSTPKPDFPGYSTPKPDFLEYSTPKPNFSGYSAAQNQNGFSTPSPIFESYSTPGSILQNSPLQGSSGGYSPKFNSQSYDVPSVNYAGYSTTAASPTYSSSYSSSSSLGSQINEKPIVENESTPKTSTGPKYSIENGVRYEHKIVWKYPNGDVSEIGPNGRATPYSEFNGASKPKANPTYQAPVAAGSLDKTANSGYATDSKNIYSQRPATFPTEQTRTKSTQFASSTSIFNNEPSIANSPTANSALKFHYQSQYSASNQPPSKPSQGLGSVAAVNFKTTFANSQGRFTPTSTKQPQLVSSYPIDSPEAEYPSRGYTAGNSYVGTGDRGATAFAYSHTSQIPTSRGQNNEVYTQHGKVSPTILSKYPPHVQQYLKKALDDKDQESSRYEIANSQAFSNTDYSNLLSYNPSISQYIENPSSILNAQPTYVQSGNSLVPVIILRVDGAPPVQPKVAPNINLKALLQQYLLQYAQTVKGLTDQPVYNGDSYGRTTWASRNKQPTGFSPSQSSTDPLFGSSQFPDSLSRHLSQDSSLNPSFIQNFGERIAEGSLSAHQSESFFAKSDSSRSSGKQRVKNVEIVDDPRYTTYKSGRDIKS